MAEVGGRPQWLIDYVVGLAGRDVSKRSYQSKVAVLVDETVGKRSECSVYLASL